jgi:hypothetical protein
MGQGFLIVFSYLEAMHTAFDHSRRNFTRQRSPLCELGIIAFLEKA